MRTCLERNLNLALQVLEAKGERRRLRKPDGRGAAQRAARRFAAAFPAAGRAGDRLQRARRRRAARFDAGRHPRGGRDGSRAGTLPRDVSGYGRARAGACGAGDRTGAARRRSAGAVSGAAAVGRAIRIFCNNRCSESLHIDLAALAAQALSGARCERGALKDQIVESLFAAAERICSGVVSAPDGADRRRQLRLDRALTNKWLALARRRFPIMLLLLAGIFWITITGANIPSQWLHTALFRIEECSTTRFAVCRCRWPARLIVHGVPGARLGGLRDAAADGDFLPAFLRCLRMSGYLPRVAFNLDRCFQAAAMPAANRR